MIRMMREVWVPTTISDVKITSHYKNIVNIDLSILKIF